MDNGQNIMNIQNISFLHNFSWLCDVRIKSWPVYEYEIDYVEKEIFISSVFDIPTNLIITFNGE